MNLVIFRGIWGIFNSFKSWLPILSNSLTTLLFENSCCFFLNTLFSDRHYRILDWSKRRMHMWKFYRCQALLFTAGHLRLCCRQRPIIHCIRWWRWRSGTLAAWYHSHWCRRCQNSTGINWIPRECSSSERTIFYGTPENFLAHLMKIWKTNIRLLPKHYQ